MVDGDDGGQHKGSLFPSMEDRSRGRADGCGSNNRGVVGDKRGGMGNHVGGGVGHGG